jgi:hypothetical protein
MAWFFAVFATRALGDWAQIESSLAPDGTVLRFTVGVLAIAILLFGLGCIDIYTLRRGENLVSWVHGTEPL